MRPVEAAGSGVPVLRVRTRRIGDPGPLLELLPAAAHVAWVRGGDGIVGWGEAAALRSDGPDRFGVADRWWRELATAADIVDEVGRPGTGPVAFGTFGFADGAGERSRGSALVVPRTVVGRRGDDCWLTTIADAADDPEGAEPSRGDVAAPSDPAGSGVPGTVLDDPVERRDRWRHAVATAVRRIGAGEVAKVVLARVVTARFPEPLDLRLPLRRLATDYRDCWTFHVDGFFGATPELLVRLDADTRVTSRVLAGTISRPRDATAQDDEHLATLLAESAKDVAEHEFAVRSVVDALTPQCVEVHAPEQPFVLRLPNVMHLATDVTATARRGTTVLALAGALHPSAAVGGTPTVEAVRMIADLEDFDRDRYAGPVGWVGASGDGEWGIGLRSAQLSSDARSARLFAGCGIVADSDPALELAETDAKLVPVLSCLGAPPATKPLGWRA